MSLQSIASKPGIGKPVQLTAIRMSTSATVRPASSSARPAAAWARLRPSPTKRSWRSATPSCLSIDSSGLTKYRVRTEVCCIMSTPVDSRGESAKRSPNAAIMSSWQA